jgi:uncharacterized protein (DUF488 family)
MSALREADPRASAADLSNASLRALPDRQVRATRDSPLAVLTVGHSTRPLEEFLNLLSAHAVARLVDVRTVPRSRHNPQFNRESLPAALEAVGIAHEHAPGLGGFRRTHMGSPNAGWRNLSFRGFADYMLTSEFSDHLAGLIERASRERTALMCAEAVPWRCHRSLIADALLVRGIRVEEILDGPRSRPHTLTPFARVDGTTITYPPPPR